KGLGEQGKVLYLSSGTASSRRYCWPFSPVLLLPVLFDSFVTLPWSKVRFGRFAHACKKD
ncbi:MAG: hypothetical protein ACJ8HJ_21575, partial [Massilia sp.]